MLADGDEDEFFLKLIDFARDFGSRDQANDALVIRTEYRRVSRRESRGLAEMGVIDLSLRQLLYRALDVKEDIVQGYRRAA